ncbi:MAG: phage head closure protein [Alphaproteobacteria bacterium]|nr:phage head closure protein [Alphaproteobacteria bacterium]
MKIGNLRKQIALQAEQQTPDGAGGYALAWTTLATVWADISPATGREVYTAGHLEGRVTHKVTIRWRSDITITTDMRLLYNARTFNIRAVMNQDEANQYATLLVEEGTAT